MMNYNERFIRIENRIVPISRVKGMELKGKTISATIANHIVEGGEYLPKDITLTVECETEELANAKFNEFEEKLNGVVAIPFAETYNNTFYS